MADSKLEYHRQNIEHARRAANIEVSAPYLPFDALRIALDARPDATLFRAGVADLWLDISKQTGARRREARKPPSPFKKSKTNEKVATKGEVGVWGDAWLLIEAAAVMQRSRTGAGRHFAESIVNRRAPFLVLRTRSTTEVVGHCAWLPQRAAPDLDALPSEDFDVAWLRPSAALRLRWQRTEEARSWQALVEACHRIIESEIDRSIIAHATVEYGAASKV